MRLTFSFSRNTARLLAVNSQGLDAGRNGRVDRRALLALIKKIGLVQVDPLNVVERSHYLVLLSRLGIFDRADFDSLLYPGRDLFEQWAHAASIIHREAYQFFQPVFEKRRRLPLRYGRQKALGKEPRLIIDAVLDQVKKRGPSSSQDFDDGYGRRRTWWNRKPARVALDVLYYEGFLALHRRINFRCVYDLPTRVFGSDHSACRTLDDYHRWAAAKSVACLGIATVPQIADYYRQGARDVKAAVDYLVRRRTLSTVQVPGWNERGYILTSAIKLASELDAGRHSPVNTSFLSPFDNLIWDRKRTFELFGFDYRTEIYVPVGNRSFGYYVLPILHNGQLVGRVDARLDRSARTLNFNKIHLEDGHSLTPTLLHGLKSATVELAEFLNADNLAIREARPVRLRAALMKAFKTK